MSLLYPDTFDERHFSVTEVAEKLRVSRRTVLRLAKEEPGVLKFRIGPKKANTLYIFPESVLRRIYNRVTA